MQHKSARDNTPPESTVGVVIGGAVLLRGVGELGVAGGRVAGEGEEEDGGAGGGGDGGGVGTANSGWIGAQERT